MHATDTHPHRLMKQPAGYEEHAKRGRLENDELVLCPRNDANAVGRLSQRRTYIGSALKTPRVTVSLLEERGRA